MPPSGGGRGGYFAAFFALYQRFEHGNQRNTIGSAYNKITKKNNHLSLGTNNSARKETAIITPIKDVTTILDQFFPLCATMANAITVAQHKTDMRFVLLKNAAKLYVI